MATWRVATIGEVDNCAWLDIGSRWSGLAVGCSKSLNGDAYDGKGNRLRLLLEQLRRMTSMHSWEDSQVVIWVF